MKNTAVLSFIAASAAVARAQVSISNGTYTCAIPNGAYCSGDSLKTDIIIRCDENGVGQAGRCSDNLDGEPPVGDYPALCYQTSDNSGDAACEKNCVVYGASGNGNGTWTLPADECTPTYTASGSSSVAATTVTSSATAAATTTVVATFTSSEECDTSVTSTVAATTVSSSSEECESWTTSTVAATGTTITDIVTDSTTICPESGSASVTVPVTFTSASASASVSTNGTVTFTSATSGRNSTVTSTGGAGSGSSSSSATAVPVGPTKTTSAITVSTAGAAALGFSGALGAVGLVAAYIL